MYQPLKDVTAILKVSFEGELVEEMELISMPTLDVGTSIVSYNYIPTEGWQRGTYNFRIELYTQGELYSQSTEVQMVAAPSEVGVPAAPFNLLLMVSIAAGVLVVGMAILLMVLLRRRRQY